MDRSYKESLARQVKAIETAFEPVKETIEVPACRISFANGAAAETRYWGKKTKTTQRPKTGFEIKEEYSESEMLPVEADDLLLAIQRAFKAELAEMGKAGELLLESDIYNDAPFGLKLLNGPKGKNLMTNTQILRLAKEAAIQAQRDAVAHDLRVGRSIRTAGMPPSNWTPTTGPTDQLTP